MGGDRFNTTLATLMDDGSAVVCEVTKPSRKTPFEMYRLAELNTPLVASGPAGQKHSDKLVRQVGPSGPD